MRELENIIDKNKNEIEIKIENNILNSIGNIIVLTIFLIINIIISYKLKLNIIVQIIILILVILILYLISNFIFSKKKIEKFLNITHNISQRVIKPIETLKKYNDEPLYNFFINTSHNSYIPFTQNLDIVSLESIKRALEMGARVIELDCFCKNNIGKSDDDMIPIVAHGFENKLGDIITTSYILFEDCINIIDNFSLTTSDPIIVCLELNTNNILEVQKNIKNIIINKLKKKNKLLKYNYKYSYLGNDKIYFTKDKIKNLFNKIIFVCGKGATSELNDIIDGNLNDNNYMGNLPHKNNKLEKINKKSILHRVYPNPDILGHFSYNFDPIKLWKNNYQLIALNFQIFDKHLINNLAFFKDYSYIHYSLK